MTGYVLGEEFSTLSSTLLIQRIPESFDGDVVIGTRFQRDISGRGMAYFGTITQELDVHVWDLRRIFRRIRDIELSYE